MRKPAESTAPEGMFVTQATWTQRAHEVVLYLDEKGVEHNLIPSPSITYISFCIQNINHKFFTRVVDPWFREFAKQNDVRYSYDTIRIGPERVIARAWDLQIEVTTNPHWEDREW